MFQLPKDIIQKIFDYDNTFHKYYKSINNQILIYSTFLHAFQKQYNYQISFIQFLNHQKNHESLFKSLIFKYVNQHIKIINVDYSKYTDIVKKIPSQAIVILTKIDDKYRYFYIKNKLFKDDKKQIFVCPKYLTIKNKREIDSYIIGELF